MTDRTILDNARNMLLVTAGSFCLSVASLSTPSLTSQRLQQEERSEQAKTPAQIIPLQSSKT